ncbi:MAG: single-stranded-DNA-specific exonuclease RecJ [Sulfurimonas sp. RIFOXYD12_FULL_33_39]|uniref:single-stranded-DNA-specific exonuclease RecJ n=1 Tax=unclassified Sulfurimonas TaxID=2623549 RepID=UPI0008AE1599|nr:MULTISPECIES: single-stranded-DNA-specific exonuclease RecJ [unclassified Sulfurimonas]OHE06897.1 MAG: single-stranded-DNA-specific exonuclease RecJ [Sulfurimonas sp. RIFCSPLOWO2_12_FULL_34_6]OHE10962.1 MAG: single-stranded-DNA-specific exonuclease RecJ [Sulfurimonas sp. RIFOXYD12_FULL_33_39]OHE13269.1 MAG: single-stranded-DNA-specific exonuclease RecJ [Sulfurimonas sp. RIFOXYD2_FULL_34_21]
MQIFDEVPILDKSALFKLLSQRFESDEKKLSQIPNPELLHDANRAAKKIADAIREKKKIALVGDYDVDGVTSTAIMVEFFRQIPYPIEAIIPNRFSDGYGVSPNILKKVDAELIITVDNGISAIEAADICQERGIELIITDHHTPPKILPCAYAIVNPKLSTCSYPFEEICGAQVAWLLLGVVKKELNLFIDMKEFLDLLAIAIIADIMPLTNINRAIVKEGLKILATSSRPSCIIIRDFLNKSSITSEDIAFQVAPRINSAGRLEDAKIALEFLTAQSIDIAYEKFEKLNTLNELRRNVEAQTTIEALELANNDDALIVVAKDGWHEGVAGIVAARLVEHFSKPAIVLTIKEGIAKGSARSIGNINIYELIKNNSSFLTKFGGHKMAAGLGLREQDIDFFKNAINKSASRLDSNDFISLDEVIGIIPSSEIDFEILNLLEYFEPYGEANLRPSFLIKDAEILEISYFGKDKSHSKIRVRQLTHDKKIIELVLFKKVIQFPKEKKLTCSYKIAKNEYNNAVSVQLIINKIYDY